MTATQTRGTDVLYERRGAAAWVTFNRPQSRNAMTFEMYEELEAICDEVEQDPHHAARRWLDRLLASLADDLRYKAETGRQVDAWLRGLVDDHHMQALLHAVLVDVAASVRTSLDDLDGGLQARLTALVGGAARRVLGDAALQARIEERLHAAVGHLVERYGDTVVALISRTVRGWEAQDASARIEAAVGRDLQFIRINGTVVGALAGLVLHGVAVLVG